MTLRGSAVERSTLEALKFAVPKSLEDIVVVMVEETCLVVLGTSGICGR